MTTKIIPPTFITQSEEQLDNGYDPKVARGLLQFVKPYAPQMFFALILMIIVTTAAVSGPYFVKLGIDEGIFKNDVTARILEALGLAAPGTVRAGLLFTAESEVRGSLATELPHELRRPPREGALPPGDGGAPSPHRSPPWPRAPMPTSPEAGRSTSSPGR